METQEKFIQMGNTKLIIMQSCFVDNPFYGEFDGFISACSEIKDTGDGVYYKRTEAKTTEELIKMVEADGYIVKPLYRWLDHSDNIHLYTDGNGYGWHDNFAGLLIREKDEYITSVDDFKRIADTLHDWQAYLNSQIYTVEIMVDNETVTTWQGIYGLDSLKDFLKSRFNLSISDDELLTKINMDY